MPVHLESITTENDEEFLLDIVNTTIKKGFPAFVSSDENLLSIAYPLEHEKQVIGEAFVVTKIDMENPVLLDCDLVINNKPQAIHLLKYHSKSGETNERYLAELIDDKDVPFFIETVNRIAVWDPKIEGMALKANFSAFAFKIDIHDSIKDYHKKIGFNPVKTKAGPVTGFSEKFCAPMSEDNVPYTYFLGTVDDVLDVEIRLEKGTILFSVIYVDSHFGIIPVVASRDVFDLSKLEKGRIIEVSADIKANLAADASPMAIADI